MSYSLWILKALGGGIDQLGSFDSYGELLQAVSKMEIERPLDHNAVVALRDAGKPVQAWRVPSIVEDPIDSIPGAIFDIIFATKE